MRERLDEAFDVEEVDVTAAGGPVERRRRSRPGDGDRPRLAFGRKARPDLEQPDVVTPVAQIVRNGVDQTGNERGP